MITPADGASAPGPYAEVPVCGMDVMAPQADLTGAVAASVSATGARQAQTRTMLESPAGFAVGSGNSGYDILGGSSGGGGEDWPSDVQPRG
jgi:hypothetical protein